MLISSIILFSSLESSFGEGHYWKENIIATSIGFEDSVILELKNSRGNTASIDTVRIWLGENNEFKSFKTEQGWMGKNTPQGVIIFTSENETIPGEKVKFGIKTIKQNPIINWKAVDKEGDVIKSGITKITITELDINKSELNKPKNTAIKDDSRFRLIPEQPNADSNFRLIGENFVPKQNVDFYIQDELIETIRIDNDGKILFTGKIPSTIKNDRTEFVIQDLTGNEKTLSLRIHENENRKISEIVKLSIGNTPKDVKLGETIIFTGMGTPNVTITISSKNNAGDIDHIETIQIGTDGKWNYEHLFSPDLEIGNMSIEIDDGKSRILRNFSVINPTLINVLSEKTMYEPGETVSFNGLAIPNKEISIILEDSIGIQVYSRSLSVGDLGNLSFEINISRDSIEGTYVLYLYQGDEEGITTFGVGQEPESILILKPTKINFSISEDVEILIQGASNAQVSIILVDSANREMLSKSINLGPDGRELYKISSGELSTGSYTISGQRGESSDEAVFSVGFTTGSGIISVQTTKSEYSQGDQILILGSTGTANVLLEMKIINPDGKTIKKVDIFSDQAGVFKLDNFRIPMDGKIGSWKIDVKSGSNFDSLEFKVKDDSNEFIILLEKTTFSANEFMIINGSGASGTTISLKIFNSNGDEIVVLGFAAKEDGNYSTTWQIPNDIISGEYEILIDDGIKNNSMEFTII
jgi:hypothetical protein